MQRLEDTEFQEIKAILESEDPQDRVFTLVDLGSEPTGDPRLLPLLRRLLEDHTITLISIPWSWGEVRWVAFLALLAELLVQGDSPPIALRDTFFPMKRLQIERLR